VPILNEDKIGTEKVMSTRTWSRFSINSTSITFAEDFSEKSGKDDVLKQNA
jgi:hypothetical protein